MNYEFSLSLSLPSPLYLPVLCSAVVLHFGGLIDEGVKHPASHKSKYRCAVQATRA